MGTCDFCGKDALYDGKTKTGSWAYMCEDCFKKNGINIKGLFTKLGKGGATDEKPR